jgi:hypothetical protein
MTLGQLIWGSNPGISKLTSGECFEKWILYEIYREISF